MKALRVLLLLPALALSQPSGLHIVGANLLTLCGEPVSIEYLVTAEDNAGILTVSAFDSPREDFDKQVEKVREVMKQGGPAKVIELNKKCQKT